MCFFFFNTVVSLYRTCQDAKKKCDISEGAIERGHYKIKKVDNLQVNVCINFQNFVYMHIVLFLIKLTIDNYFYFTGHTKFNFKMWLRQNLLSIWEIQKESDITGDYCILKEIVLTI